MPRLRPYWTNRLARSAWVSLEGFWVGRMNRPVVPAGPGMERRGREAVRRHVHAEPLPDLAPGGGEVEVRRKHVELVLGRPVHFLLPLLQPPPIGRILAVHHVLAHRPAGPLDQIQALGRHPLEAGHLLTVREEAHAAVLLQVVVYRVERGPRTGAQQDQVPLAAVLKRADEEALLAQVTGHAKNAPIHQRLRGPRAPHHDPDLAGLQVEHAGGGGRRLAAGDLAGVLGELLRGVVFEERLACLDQGPRRVHPYAPYQGHLDSKSHWLDLLLAVIQIS